MYQMSVDFKHNLKERYYLLEEGEEIAELHRTYQNPLLKIASFGSRKVLEYSIEASAIGTFEKVTIQQQLKLKGLKWQGQSSGIGIFQLTMPDLSSYPNPIFELKSAVLELTLRHDIKGQILFEEQGVVIQQVSYRKGRLIFEVETEVLSLLEIAALGHAVIYAGK